MNTENKLVSQKSQTKDYIESAIFAALIALGALITIPLGPVPITLQNFFVFMTGLVLKPKQALLSTVLYTLLGLVGLPIFAGFSGGPQSVLSPAFGFILGFIPISYLISKYSQGEKNPWKIFLSLILADILLYAIGLPYLYLILTKINGLPMTLASSLKTGMVPFIIPDLVKALLAAILGPKILSALNRN